MSMMMVAARIRRKLAGYPQLVKLKTAIWAMANPSDARIIECFPMFTPNSSGSIRERAALTIEAANQTLPRLLELLSLTGRKIEDPIQIESFLDSDDKRAAAEKLKELCDRYGSDKAHPHDYYWLYGSILVDRKAITALLEVGLGTNNPSVVSHMGRDGKPGASLRAFRDFLPNAQIYGVDVDQKILFSEDRIATFFVDQTQPRSFDAIADAVDAISFDLIIDDGLHSPSANLTTLLFAIEKLKPGGWLVIEDIPGPTLPVWQMIASLMPHPYHSRVVAAKKAFLFTVQRVA